MPGLVVHLHLDQYVAGEELALTAALLALLHLDDLLGRHENLAKLALKTHALDALLQRCLHLVLEVRIGVNDVPA